MKALLALGFAACLILAPTSGRAEGCADLPPPSVKIVRLDDAVTLNTETSFKSLTALGAAFAQPGGKVLGLTHGTASVRIESSIRGYVDPGGQWECASPQVVMTYGFTPMTVRIAREIPVGSCAYREIYQHEQRHVKAYQAHLAAIEQGIGDALRQRFATGTPSSAPAGETRARIQKELDERWVPYVKREMDRVAVAQAAIDTQEEYARVAGICNGEIRQFAR